jgi:hypothetical protein
MVDLADGQVVRSLVGLRRKLGLTATTQAAAAAATDEADELNATDEDDRWEAVWAFRKERRCAPDGLLYDEDALPDVDALGAGGRRGEGDGLGEEGDGGGREGGQGRGALAAGPSQTRSASSRSRQPLMARSRGVIGRLMRFIPTRYASCAAPARR